MKKKLILGMLSACLMLTLTGCGEDKVGNRFYRYNTALKDNWDNTYYITVDKETNILYIQRNGILTPLLDAEGKPTKDSFDWKNAVVRQAPNIK